MRNKFIEKKINLTKMMGLMDTIYIVKNHYHDIVINTPDMSFSLKSREGCENDKNILLSLLILIVLIGCSNDDVYNNSIQKGLDYMASEEYKKAESAFELALDEKPDDEKATALLGQTVNNQESLKESMFTPILEKSKS